MLALSTAAVTAFSPVAYTSPSLLQRAARTQVNMAEAVNLDQDVLAKFMALDAGDKIQAEYLWIDAIGEVRSKCRTGAKSKATLDQLPSWNYDGSSTDQAPGDDSEVIIKPKAIFKDPFRGGDNILVLTDTYVRATPPTHSAARPVIPSLARIAHLASCVPVRV